MDRRLGFLLLCSTVLLFHVRAGSVQGNLQTASVEVVIYENTGQDYTTYTYELKGTFSKAGAATSAEGDILQAKRAMQRGATAIIFDTTDNPEAVSELNANKGKAKRPIVLIDGQDAKKLMNIIKNQRVPRARIQYGVAGYTPQRAANEYLDMVIFMTFFILVSVICFILLLKIKWRQKQKETSLTRMALHALSRMETRKYQSDMCSLDRSSFDVESLINSTTTLNSTEKTSKCIICLEKFKNGQDVRIVPCHHEFHKDCVDPWLLSNFTCPLCMLNIVDPYQLSERGSGDENAFWFALGRVYTSRFTKDLLQNKAFNENRKGTQEITKTWNTDRPQVDVKSVDDLTSLSPLTEDMGTPLVAVNPFQDVDELYDEGMESKYRMNSAVKTRELPPHIFAIGQKAYCDLKKGFETSNQSIIVSGESGAGKFYIEEMEFEYKEDYNEFFNYDLTINFPDQTEVLGVQNFQILLDKIVPFAEENGRLDDVEMLASSHTYDFKMKTRRGRITDYQNANGNLNAQLNHIHGNNPLCLEYFDKKDEDCDENQESALLSDVSEPVLADELEDCLNDVEPSNINDSALLCEEILIPETAKSPMSNVEIDASAESSDELEDNVTDAGPSRLDIAMVTSAQSSDELEDNVTDAGPSCLDIAMATFAQSSDEVGDSVNDAGPSCLDIAMVTSAQSSDELGDSVNDAGPSCLDIVMATFAQSSDEVGDSVNDAGPSCLDIAMVTSAQSSAQSSDELGDSVNDAGPSCLDIVMATFAQSSDEVGDSVTDAGPSCLDIAMVTSAQSSDELGDSVTDAGPSCLDIAMVTSAQSSDELGDNVTDAGPSCLDIAMVTSAQSSDELGDNVTDAGPSCLDIAMVTSAQLSDELGDNVTDARPS
ncbi:hypothetical protein QZH41_014870 [Actinostola sp. cb2023]|nr:hypothetical protein QZH41_014870 [Actinostola sp. cb2023]